MHLGDNAVCPCDVLTISLEECISQNVVMNDQLLSDEKMEDFPGDLIGFEMPWDTLFCNRQQFFRIHCNHTVESKCRRTKLPEGCQNHSYSLAFCNPTSSFQKGRMAWWEFPKSRLLYLSSLQEAFASLSCR